MPMHCTVKKQAGKDRDHAIRRKEIEGTVMMLFITQIVIQAA